MSDIGTVAQSTAGDAGGGTASLGRSVPRKEDRRLVTGHGRYVSDLDLPRMRHAAFLRSPHGHARITGVDTSAARDAGYRVFTGADFAGIALRAQSELPSYVETSQPVIALEKVRFAGETVAAVVAADRYLAEDGLELIEVSYEPLPPPSAPGRPRANRCIRRRRTTCCSSARSRPARSGTHSGPPRSSSSAN